MERIVPAHVVVAGGGVGGLAAAIRLASVGARVTLFERADRPGGKLREIAVGERRIDAGPTVLTMPHVFEALFAAAGRRLADHLTLIPLDPACRHIFPDGSRLDLFNDHERSREAIRDFAGEAEARGFDAFRSHAARIFSIVQGPFMEQPAPSSPLAMLHPSRILRIPDLLRIDARRTLWQALSSFFRDERLRALFGRYATYNGSSPFHAPATLSVIAHVEQAFGVWAVKGGIALLAEALAEVARSLGVTIRTSAEVERIVVDGGRARGVVVAGETIEADAVVANCDALHLHERLLAGEARAKSQAKRVARSEPSLSAWVLLAVAGVGDFPLAHHNVFFSSDYPREFAELIDEQRPPSQPTVYLCAGDRRPEDHDPGSLIQDHGSSDASPSAARSPERMLLLTNAPPLDAAGSIDWNVEGSRCCARMLETLSTNGLHLSPVAERAVTPVDFEARFPSSRGSLYGASSNARTAAFERPPNRVPGFRHLYLVGGSAHPGAGLPMVALSARIATELLSTDLGLARSPRPGATPGGTSTR